MANPINIGANPNDGTGDTLRDAFNKVNLDLKNNLVVVKQPSDFGVINSNTLYYIQGFIDMGANVITIPEGVNLSLAGDGYQLSGLFSSEDNYNMFDYAGNGCGDVFFRGLDLRVDGANSYLGQLKGNTNFEVLSFIEVNFSDCTEGFRIEEFRQVEEFNTGRFGGSPKFTLTGNFIGGYLIERSLTRFLDDTSTEPLFSAGTGLIFNSRFVSNMNLDLGTNGEYLDFSPSNFNSSDLLQLQDGIITRDGNFETDYLSIFPNIDETNNESLWRNNVGIPNTDRGGLLTITSEVTTVISTVNVWVDLAGTFTLSKDQHVDSPANGQVRNNSDIPVDYKTNVQVLIDGGPNDVLEVRATIFRFATSTFEPQEIFSDAVNNNVGGNDFARIRMFDNFTLFPGDYVKYEARNTSDTSNFTAVEGSSKFKLEER